MHRTVSDYIVDLVQNSIEARSSMVKVEISQESEHIKVYIKDNGTGMDEETLARVRDPFFTGGGKHEKRKVGLGISFLAQCVAQCGGRWDISSQKGTGTSLFFSFELSNPDSPPLGNLVSAMVCCMGMQGGYDLKIHRAYGKDSYSVQRSELIEALGDLEDAQSLIAVRTYLRTLEKELLQKGNSENG
ncbi:MAG: sensor histidine kinase [Chitinispirillaceae bacterium]